jgi:outer membrane protein TolC
VLYQPLSKVEALNIALLYSGTIRQAQRDVEAAAGVAIQTRAIVYPHLIQTGQYRARQDSLIEANQNRDIPKTKITIPGVDITEIGGGVSPREIKLPGRTIEFGGGTLPLANNQDWIADIKVVQSIYEGGRILSAMRSARFIREQSFLIFESIVADTLLSVSNAYDDVLSTAQQVEVRAASVKLLRAYLRDTKIRADAGAVTEFDVLREEVEVANAEAALVQAEGAHRDAKQIFVEQLGQNLPTTVSDNLPLNLTTPLDDHPYYGELPAALAAALVNRSEIAALEVEELLRNEAIITAKAGNKPSVQAFGGYEMLSKVQTRNAGDHLQGSLVGAQVSWAIFDGYLTKGRVVEAVALRKKAGEAKAETTRVVELEVRTAWSALRTARAVLDALGKTLAKAVKALELVEIRYTEGVATQVEVLSAQTALTDARATYVQGLRDFSVARARLLRATGENLPRNSGCSCNSGRRN